MSRQEFFELGPEASSAVRFAGRDKLPYVKLAAAPLRSQIGGDLLVSKQCGSFAELQDEILKMKGELDQILIEAKERFARGL